MTRDGLQHWAAEQLSENKRLMCLWATGTGKSNIALKFIKDHPGTRTLILVPESNNIQNWYDEFDKFGVSFFGVEIACYASLHKFKDTGWDLLVLDEAPHVDTDLKYDLLSTINAEHVLALGAVISDEEQLTLKSLYGNFTKSVVTLDMCIVWGILPPPQVRVIHIKLDDIAGSYTFEGKTLDSKRYYEALSTKVSNAVVVYNSRPNELTKHKMNLAGAERKRALGQMKQYVIAKICEELKKNNKRFICFCSTVAQAELLGKENAFTSKSKKSLDHLNRFNNHEIDSLYVVGKCIEGQNLRDIECGVIGQIGGTQRITVQEIGRMMRSTNPVIYIPVIDDTKDTSFLYTLTSSISRNYISHHYYNPSKQNY